MALTEDEKNIFEVIDEGLAQMFLVEAELDGERVAVINVIFEDSDDSTVSRPVAVILTDDMFDRLTPPEGVELIELRVGESQESDSLGKDSEDDGRG